ncbi:GGDEF domain-containing protein [Amycolatopsis anabasis]|uniref:GGDEF domain-containing protein n=1 Tax=Amycolatopsis anabasis TaxID=1840409 RepID=UPI00131EC7F8|nr:GGDEF domain-containing protein [Amycolatopsis anabasis]
MSDAEERVRRTVSAWRAGSIALGWAYPDDWEVPEVIEVAEAALGEADLLGPLERLGRARARGGIDLRETLADLLTLREVLDTEASTSDDLPSAWLRAAAEGWADEAADELALSRLDDGLTGLATAPYLRTRLLEVYQECDANSVETSARYEFVAVALDVSGLPTMTALAAMVLTAAALDAVFSNGETRALLATTTAVVLTPRSGLVPARALTARAFVERGLAVEHIPADVVRVWRVRLPGTYAAACRLIRALSRGSHEIDPHLQSGLGVPK